MESVRSFCRCLRITIYLAVFGALLVWRPVLSGNVQGEAVSNTLNLGVLIPWTDEWVIGPSIGSAVILGIQEVEDRQLLPGYTIDWEWKDTHCTARRGLAMAVELWSESTDLDAIIGGGCSVVCEPVSLLSAAWNIPFVSFGCTSNSLSSKYNNPTFTRSVGTWDQLAPMFDALCDRFDWDRLGIIASTEHIHQLTGSVIKEELEEAGKTVKYHAIESTVEGVETVPESLEKAERMVKKIKNEARIILLLLYPSDIKNLMLLFYDQGMTEGGYLFIVMDASPHIVDQHGTERRDDFERAMESVVSANLRKPVSAEWDAFAQDVIDNFSDSKFDGVDHLAATANISEVDVHAGMLHDAVLQWAIGVNITLQELGESSIDNGINITNNILGLQFQGITGNISITTNGDRMPDYSLEIVNYGQYVRLMDWYTSDGRLEKVYNGDDPDDWSGILWPGNSTRPPKGIPDCGWRGELCTKSMTVAIVVPLVLLCIILIVLTAFFFVRRHMRFEADLNAIGLWRVDWNDITRPRAAKNAELSRATLRTTKTFASLCEGMEKQIFTEIAQYKGKLVAVKRINKYSIESFDRSLLLELKHMRDLHHENLNHFVGACTEAPHVCVLMVYAQKGSLEDVLHNDSINLSWDFKISIANDIAKGMMYLQHSVFGSHGHLTSANCVVDSRWICKVTDYGLGIFKSGQRRDDRNEYQICQSLLWTAPELLRLQEMPMYGTQEGDVYSYGIILQEIVMRDAPYSANEPQLGPEEIIEIVRSRSERPYRPTLPPEICSIDWIDLMRSCWKEDPLLRPNFHRIKSCLREINGGKNVNVIDNMINMLEQHAEHLEERVEERTEELQVERNRVQSLLYNILPKSVADSLRDGVHVEPEIFESVTVFNSRIVGFNKIAAQSSPLQVVTLLNEFYMVLDDVIDKFDLYKVDTMGDSHMVVSGVPVRNEGAHVKEVSAMALNLLSTLTSFTISHLPEEMLLLRIGIHSGPCIAGVVGLKMPRYGLFGDTVTTASLIESHGQPLKIHISSATADLLSELGGFMLECRGEIAVKGKGWMRTHWLTGMDGFDKPLSDPNRSILSVEGL